ncbi:hypothetical protein btBTE5EL_000986 (plasmid) [Borrelia turicatae]|nr:hypothetical protein btBTE5EL_000986 [Borrelia turicatae]
MKLFLKFFYLVSNLLSRSLISDFNVVSTL